MEKHDGFSLLEVHHAFPFTAEVPPLYYYIILRQRDRLPITERPRLLHEKI